MALIAILSNANRTGDGERRCSGLRLSAKKGRWLGEILELPGVMAYGATEDEVRTNTIALAFWVIAEPIAHGEPVPINIDDYFVGA